MKRIVAMAAVLAISASALAGCSGNNTAETKASEAAQTNSTEAVTSAGESAAASGDEVYKIGICQLVQHDALDAATKGFQDALVEKLGEDRVEFDLQNASGDSANCATIVNQFVSGEADLILANATASLQAAASATDTIPILGTSITDYATALELDEWSGTTGRNISGTCDLAPLEEQAKMLNELFPDVKEVGLLYCSAEANSVYQIDMMEGYLNEMGYTCERYTFSDSNDLAAVTTSAIASSEVIYVPTDNTVASNTEIINNICLPAGIPIVAGEEDTCKGCGIVTLAISYYDLGYQTGEMAYEILANGTDVSTMPVEMITDAKKEYVASRCEELGIEVSDDYEAIEAK